MRTACNVMYVACGRPVLDDQIFSPTQPAASGQKRSSDDLEYPGRVSIALGWMQFGIAYHRRLHQIVIFLKKIYVIHLARNFMVWLVGRWAGLNRISSEILKE